MTFAPPNPPYVGPAAKTGGGGNKPINRLVIHCTVSDCCTSADAIARMFRTTTRYASAHYIVDAHKTLQSVYDSTIAYHAPPNSHSLGFELCCTLADEGRGHWDREDHKKMLARAARVVAEAALAYDVPVVKLNGAALRAGKRGICGHADVRDAWGQTTHWDPGPHFPWARFIRMVKREVKVLKGKKSPVVTPTRVSKAVDLMDRALDLLAEVPAKRKHVHKVREAIAEDVHDLPER